MNITATIKTEKDKPILSAEEQSRRSRIDAINADLPAPPYLKYTDNDGAIAEADQKAFEARVEREAHRLASYGGTRPVSVEVQASYRRVARTRLMASEGRPGLSAVATKTHKEIAALEAQMEAKRTEQARLLAVQEEHERMVARRDEAMKRFELARRRSNDSTASVQKYSDNVVKFYTADYIDGEYGTDAAGAIIASYSKILAEERLQSDWPRVEKLLLAEIKAMDEAIADFERLHGLSA